MSVIHLFVLLLILNSHYRLLNGFVLKINQLKIIISKTIQTSKCLSIELSKVKYRVLMLCTNEI